MGQNNKLTSLKVNWKINDFRKIHTESTTKTYIKDSLINETKVTSNYTIRVIDTAKFYKIKFTQSATDLTNTNEFKNSNQATQKLLTMMNVVMKGLEGFEYLVLVDKQTGEAKEVVNATELMDSVKAKLYNVVYDMGMKKGKSLQQIDSVTNVAFNGMKSKENEMIQTLLNSISLMFQCNSYKYIINGKHEEDLLVYDVNAMGIFGAEEFPAKQIIQTTKNDNGTLKIRRNLLYDKAFLLQKIKEKNKRLDNVSEDKIVIKEVEDYLLDIKSSWLINSASEVEFSTPDVKVLMLNKTTFTK